MTPQNNNPHLDELTQEDLFRKISDICNVVTLSVNVRDLLEISLKKTMELFGANRGSIFILKEDGKELILKIAFGMKISEQEQLVKRLGEGVVGMVAETKQPLIVDDISKDERFCQRQSGNNYRTPSFICTPLMIKDVLLGVINIADKESGSRFSKKELQLLDFLASQIALNYRRLQLLERFKTIVKESRTLKDELGKKNEDANRLKKQVVVQEKLASIGKLTSGIAHELNNPLDGVLRYINLSLDQVKQEEVIYDYLMEAKQGLNRIVNIVKSLLACSRGTTPSMKKIKVNDAIEEALTSVKSEIYHKNIRIEKYFDVSIPEIIDYGIERIAINLLRNSVDAVNQDGTIKLLTKIANDQILIEFSDNGCGIPQENIDKIFEPFFTTKDIDKGCGLGLTIVSEVIKAYNGKISIESRLSQGTTFTILLPYTSELVKA